MFMQQLNKTTGKTGNGTTSTAPAADQQTTTSAEGTTATGPATASTTSALSQYMNLVNGVSSGSDDSTATTTESIPVPPPDPQMTALQAAAVAYSQHQQMIAAAAAVQPQQQSQAPPADQSQSDNYQMTQQQYEMYCHNYYQQQHQQHRQPMPQSFAPPVRYPPRYPGQYHQVNHQYHPNNMRQQMPRFRGPHPPHQHQQAMPVRIRAPPPPQQPPPPPPAPAIPQPAVASEDISMLIKLKNQHEKFETMYKNWMDQFEMWKTNNATHPQAGEITKEWMDWQEKLLKRRSEIQSLIIQCVNKIDKPSAKPEISGVEQLLKQPSIAHLLRKQPEGTEKEKEQKKDKESDDDCQVIEVESKKTKDPEVITLAGNDNLEEGEIKDDTVVAKTSASADQQPARRVTTITVIPDPAASTCTNCKTSGHEASKCPSSTTSSAAAAKGAKGANPMSQNSRYELSDDEYGDEDPQVVKEVVPAVPEETEEEIEKKKAEQKANQDKFFNLCIGKMHQIIGRNASVSSNGTPAVPSPFYHNRLNPQAAAGTRTGATAAKTALFPHVASSGAYHVNFVRPSRLNDDTPLRNRSPPPDYVPPGLPAPKICSKCSKIGHSPSKCENVRLPRCFNCKQIGHGSSDCPNEPAQANEPPEPIPMSMRRRKVYSESQDLFPEAPKKIVSEGEAPPVPKYGFLNPQSKFLIHNFEEEFYRLPSEPEFKIVQDPVIPRRDPAEILAEEEREIEQQLAQQTAGRNSQI